ncbi:MAG: 50S ribosomal protein L16 [Nanoarchaeota archaeon]|nr:50S ribosomal protein L16 [Nanoarchaeota archaeon]
MAKLRKFSAYQKVERPYTRISKYRKKAYVRANPNIKIVRFEMGDCKKDFQVTLELLSKDKRQIRHNAIESGRQAANRLLEKDVGKESFHMKIRIYPFHILRENPLAAGAGADRMSTGMKKSFGKAIGAAAQVKEGQVLVTLKVNKQHVATAKDALRRFSCKMPVSCRTVITGA